MIPSLAAPFLLALALLSGPEVDGGVPANVLILVADDLGVDILSSYGMGAQVPPTPVLDVLASNGVRFVNAYASPVCSPTRACLMTGRYGFRTGVGTVVQPEDTVILPDTEVTIPEMLDLGTAGGVAHAAFGKWHLGSDVVDGLLAPNVAGWSHFAGSLYNLNKGASVAYDNWEKVVDGVAAQTTVYATTDTVDSALSWLASAPEPWVAYVAFNAPHSPFHEPPAGLFTLDLSGAGDPAVDPRPYYEAMVEAMDTEIGRLLIGIDPAVLSRTTTVFLGDNGTPGTTTLAPFDPGHAKGTVFEGGTNVPLIIVGPAVQQPGTTSNAFVHAVDVFATVAELSGVDVAATLPGLTLDSISMVPYLVDSNTHGKRPRSFAEFFTPNPVGMWPPFLCQEDKGSGGPGAVSLTVCGDALAEGGVSVMDISGGPPSALGWMLLSFFCTPVPVAGGTLVPFPIQWSVLVLLDANGNLTAPVPGGTAGFGSSFELYVQYVGQDAAQPQGLVLSNAVALSFLEPALRRRVVRNGRYKLHRLETDVGAITEVERRFYDMLVDPFETTDLIQVGLSAGEQAVLLQLEAELDALLSSQ